MAEFTRDDLVAIIEGVDIPIELSEAQHDVIGSYFKRHVYVNTSYDELLNNSDETSESTVELMNYLAASQSQAAAAALIEIVNFIGYYGDAAMRDFHSLDDNTLLAYYVLSIQADTLRLTFTARPLSADLAMELMLRFSDRHADIDERLNALAMLAAMAALDVTDRRHDLSVLAAMAMKVIAFAHD